MLTVAWLTRSTSPSVFGATRAWCIPMAAGSESEALAAAPPVMAMACTPAAELVVRVAGTTRASRVRTAARATRPQWLRPAAVSGAVRVVVRVVVVVFIKVGAPRRSPRDPVGWRVVAGPGYRGGRLLPAGS